MQIDILTLFPSMVEGFLTESIIKRAIAERNQDEQNAVKHWEYLLHAGEKYVKPCRAYADFVLDGNSNLHYLDQILEYIYAVTNNFQ